MYVKIFFAHETHKSKNCNFKYLWEYYEKGIFYMADGIVNWYNLFGKQFGSGFQES
jgi:Leu/Phe-tRNA-protein transferase